MPNLYDSEDVEVQAKNVHIDMEPHRHADVYESELDFAPAEGDPFGKGQPEPVPNDEGIMASPHSNVSEGTSSPWYVLSRMDEGQLFEVEHEFQDYTGPVHPHVQKARDDLKSALGWTVDQIRTAVPNLDQFTQGSRPPEPGGFQKVEPGKSTGQKVGTGGFWELAKLTKELEAIPDMESDKVMTRLQSVMNDLHKLKNNMKKNPANDPETEKIAKGVENAMTGVPAVMKAAATVSKSATTDKGLWQKKMVAQPGGEGKPKPGQPQPSGLPSQRALRQQMGGFVPQKIITHPTGQDPDVPLSKAEKERRADLMRKSQVKQRIQPQVRKAGEQEPEKKGPVVPKANMARVAPKIRKAGEKEPKKKDDRKESVWHQLADLLG